MENLETKGQGSQQGETLKVNPDDLVRLTSIRDNKKLPFVERFRASLILVELKAQGLQ